MNSTENVSRVVLRSVNPPAVYEAVRECLDLCKWEDVVGRNDVVVVKPNLCTTVEGKLDMSNTALALTEAVCEVLCTRTSNIYVGEANHLRQTAHEAFAVSGYDLLSRRFGIKLVNFSELPVVHVDSEPVALELPKLLLEADVFITLPVLKTHALTYFTGALKNQWGCVPRYDRIVLHRYIDQLLVSLQRILRPALTIMDGIVGMEGRGPVNGKPRRLDLLLASTDAVALDATAMRLVGLDPYRAHHVVKAARSGLGQIEPKSIDVIGDWERHNTHFEPAVLDPAVAAMNYMSRYRWFVRYALERDTVFYPARTFVQYLRKVRLLHG